MRVKSLVRFIILEIWKKILREIVVSTIAWTWTIQAIKISMQLRIHSRKLREIGSPLRRVIGIMWLGVIGINRSRSWRRMGVPRIASKVMWRLWLRWRWHRIKFRIHRLWWIRYMDRAINPYKSSSACHLSLRAVNPKE